MHFKNRNDAAEQLIPQLSKYKDEPGVVLAVPNGGVPIAYLIAKAYNMPLELLMTKKIGHPEHGEFAIGAVGLKDHFIDDPRGATRSYIENEILRIRASLKERYKYFMDDHKPVSLENKVVIIVDEGVATGNTILSSLNMLKQQKPKKIVVAVPIAPHYSVRKFKTHVDDFICLYTPIPFVGVGMHYMDFTQVTDAEVKQFLRDANNLDKAA